jgi:sterol desaturase/sphingolipid hydroxylase (fatty acid hydroxylase superfamily)
MSHWIAASPSVLAAAGALAVLWLLESLAPFFVPGRRVPHGLRNLALGLINGVVRAAFFPAAVVALTELGRAHHLGLLRLLVLPSWAGALIAILVLDLANYLWHVASHRWTFLWRFHAVHHHDEAVDATTALRFHAGDVVLNSAFTLAVVLPMGLEVWHILLYETLLIASSIFHHANIRIPEGLDRPLRVLIVTPRMHWVHHSRWHEETDSNYSGLFSFWDRLFGTFRLRPDPATLTLGLDGYDAADYATLRGCLVTPLGPIKSRPGRSNAKARSSHEAPARSAPAPSPPSAAPRASNGALASPATHPSRGRHLPLALAVASSTPAPPRTLPPCPPMDSNAPSPARG